MRIGICLAALVFVSTGCSKSSEKKVETPSQATADPETPTQEPKPEPLPTPVTYELSEEQQATIFDSKVQSLMGEDTTLSAYRGKSIMLVNVASECGLTPQYEHLQALQDQYSEQGFTVIGFPSNQFGEQEPGTPEEILAFGKDNFKVSFPLMEKVDTNGETQHPIYSALTQIKDANGKAGDVEWNFEKFFLSADGKSITRIRPGRLPSEEGVVGLIEADLKERAQ